MTHALALIVETFSWGTENKHNSKVFIPTILHSLYVKHNHDTHFNYMPRPIPYNYILEELIVIYLATQNICEEEEEKKLFLREKHGEIEKVSMEDIYIVLPP